MDRKSMFAASTLLLLLLIINACGPSSSSGNLTTVTLTANGDLCTPARIETGQGYIVRVTLTNNGPTEAVFIYPNGPYTFSAPAGQSVLGNFTSPTQQGNYTFQCGPKDSPKEGQIVVK